MNIENLLSEKETRALVAILADKLGVEPPQITLDARIQDDFSADSLTTIEIIMAVEEHFDLSLPDEKWEKVATVGALFEVVANALQEAAPRLRNNQIEQTSAQRT